MTAKVVRVGPMKLVQGNPTRIGEFLRGCMLKGECDRIELRQIGLRGHQRVYEWLIDEEPEETRKPEDFAGYIDQMAADDAMSLRGPTQYGVFVYRKDQPEYSWRYLFMKRSDISDDGSFSETETPDATGLTSMAMRHAEAAQRNSQSLVTQLGQLFLRTINSQDTRIQQLEGKFLEVLELHEDVSSKKAERDLEARKASKAAEQKDRLLDQLQLLLPAALAKFVPGSAAKSAMAFEGLKEFMRSLKSEQVPAIMAQLDEAQQASLMQLYTALEEDAKKTEGGGEKEGES